MARCDEGHKKGEMTGAGLAFNRRGRPHLVGSVTIPFRRVNIQADNRR